MEKPSITEGEWQTMKFLNDDEFVSSITIDTGNEATRIIASLYGDDLYEDELVANAKAISAVPDMIDALMDVRGFIDNAPDGTFGNASDSYGRTWPIKHELLHNIDKALKKAGVKDA